MAPAKGARRLAWNCPRKLWGCSGRGGAGRPVRVGSGRARAGARWRRPGAIRAACGSRPGTRVDSPGPTRKPIGWGAGRAGRRKRLYDRPRTPPGRLLDTDALTDAQKDELIDYRNRLNPAVITRRIIKLQDVLVRLAKDKTDQHPPRPVPKRPARRPQGHPS